MMGTRKVKRRNRLIIGSMGTPLSFSHISSLFPIFYFAISVKYSASGPKAKAGK